MSEREPRDIAGVGTSAVDRIAERMEQTPIPLHPGNGVDGHGFKVIDPAHPEGARTIGLFPDQNIVTITTPDVSIKIKNATASAARDGVQITSERGDLRALFLKDGHVAIEVFPSLMPEPVEPPLMAGNRPDEEISALPARSHPEASGDENRGSEQPSASPQASERKEKQPRVKFTGRLGAAPHFETSPKSGLIARFPVAERTEDEHVTWHRVYSTGERAQRIQDAQLDTGTKVKVDGYRQTRDIKRKDGTMEKQEVVFAVHVKKLGQNPPSEIARREPDEQ